MLLFLILNFILTINTIPNNLVNQLKEAFCQAVEISTVLCDEGKIVDCDIFQLNVNVLIPVVIDNYKTVKMYNCDFKFENELNDNPNYCTIINVFINLKMLNMKYITFNVGI